MAFITAGFFFHSFLNISTGLQSSVIKITFLQINLYKNRKASIKENYNEFLKVARDGANLVSLFSSFHNFAPQ